MNVHRHHNRWVLDWREKGKRKRLHFRTEREAHHARATTAARLRGHPPQPTKSPLHKLAAEFTATRAGCTPKHQWATKKVTTAIATTIATIQPAQLLPHHLEPFRTSLRRYAQNTRRKYEQIARSFIDWLWQTGHAHTPPNQLFPSSHTRQQPRTQTTDTRTLQTILTTAATLPDRRDRNPTAPIARLVATLGTEAGMRISEIARARRCDWNSNTKTLTVRSAKGQAFRTIPANPNLANYLDTATTAGPPPGEHLTAQFSRRRQPLSVKELQNHWRRATKAAGHPEIHPHDLRRTWATELADWTPLPILMALAGWNSPRTAIHYLMNQGEKSKRAAIDRAYQARQEAETQAQADTPENAIAKGPTIQ